MIALMIEDGHGAILDKQECPDPRDIGLAIDLITDALAQCERGDKLVVRLEIL